LQILSESKKRFTRKDERRAEATRRQDLSRKLNPVTDKIKALEKRIEKLERRYSELEKILADPKIYEDGGKSVPLLAEFDEVKKKLDELLARWEFLNDKAEKIKAQFGDEMSDA